MIEEKSGSEHISCTEDKSPQGMSAARARVWYRRLVGLLALAIVIFALALFMNLPHLWIGPAFAFTCAEITRRICAESNPTVKLGWGDILRVCADPTKSVRHK